MKRSPSTSSGRTDDMLASERSVHTTGYVATVGGGPEGFPR